MQPPAEAEVPAPPATVVVVAMHVWEGLRTPEIVKTKHTCDSRRERNKKTNTHSNKRDKDNFENIRARVTN